MYLPKFDIDKAVRKKGDISAALFHYCTSGAGWPDHMNQATATTIATANHTFLFFIKSFIFFLL
jgi:hypothetical protein